MMTYFLGSLSVFQHFCCFSFNYTCSPPLLQVKAREAELRQMFKVMSYLVPYGTICTKIFLFLD